MENILTETEIENIESINNRIALMKSLESYPASERKAISDETINIYVSLADKLGYKSAQAELEELSLRYGYSEEYALLKKQLREAEASCAMIFDTFKTPICSLLDDLGIEYTFTYRMKSVFSIWNKIRTKHVTFDEVYDLFATRIVFKPSEKVEPIQNDGKSLPMDFINTEKLICWRIYTIITSLYRIQTERTRDWITHPKPSGYEALQITAMGPDCNWIEIQIRSTRMDELAENGLASHWKYKMENNNKGKI